MDDVFSLADQGAEVIRMHISEGLLSQPTTWRWQADFSAKWCVYNCVEDKLLPVAAVWIELPEKIDQGKADALIWAAKTLVLAQRYAFWTCASKKNQRQKALGENLKTQLAELGRSTPLQSLGNTESSCSAGTIVTWTMHVSNLTRVLGKELAKKILERKSTTDPPVELVKCSLSAGRPFE